MIPAENHDGQFANTTKFQRYDEWSRWPIAKIGQQLFIDLSGGIRLQQGSVTIPVIDVTDVANTLATNQGVEAFVNNGSEGQYVSIRLTGGRTSQRRVAYLTVKMAVAAPTGDELYADML